MYKIGIMQSRLTRSYGQSIQFFPFDSWQDEFKKAAKLGFHDIDFIFDLDRYKENPLWTEAGRKEIKKLIKETGVKVEHITADFFMRRPFFRTDEKTRKENEEILTKLMKYAEEIGAKNIELPLLDNSSLKTEGERKMLIESLNHSLKEAPKGITITLEVDLAPEKFLDLLNELNNPRFKIIYDTGNSAALGFDPAFELTMLKDFLSHIHIKDRILGGGTIALGTGAAQFDDIFATLKKINFKGNYIIQAARGIDGKEEETVSGQKQFVESYIKKYQTN